MPDPLHIATIGDGAMATVCSMIAAAKSTPDQPIEIRAWGRDPTRVAEFNAQHENTRYLPGIKLPPNLLFTTDEEGAYEGDSATLSGQAYAAMRTEVDVVSPQEYEDFIAAQKAGIQAAQDRVVGLIEKGEVP